jgi:hypothetical protein
VWPSICPGNTTPAGGGWHRLSGLLVEIGGKRWQRLFVGEVAQYQDSYRLCYVRGPEGIIVALAEQLS